MENLSKLNIEDLWRLQKWIIEELERRNNEAWDVAADNFKKAYDELMQIGFGAPQVMVGVINEEDGRNTVEHIELYNLFVDKENKTITFEAEEICLG